jgi:hypothetical protein
MDEDPDNAYTFDWVEGEQYWWMNRYDEAMDLHRGDGGEIRLADEEDRTDTLAIKGCLPRHLLKVPMTLLT